MPPKDMPQFSAVAPYYDRLMRNVPYGSWMDYVEQVVERIGATPHRVLDLACGTGRVTAGLVLRGYECVGVDCSHPMLSQARRRSDMESAPAHYVQADARRLCFKTSFDLALSLFDSLNYITEDEGLQECFAGVARALRPRGVFLFDLNTIRALRLNLFDQTHTDPDDALNYTWHSTWDPIARLCTVRMEFRYRGDMKETEFVEVHRQKGYELEETEAWLEDAGFECLEVFNAYTFRKANAFANRVFFVARKARSIS